MNNKVLVNGFKFKHHSESSGYHHLAHHIAGDYLDANTLLFKNGEIGSLKRKLNLATFEFIIKLKAKKYDIVHYLYPEDHILFSIPRENTISVATFHLATENFIERSSNKKIKKILIEMQKKNLRNLNGVIALSNAHYKELKSILPENTSVKFIPHGINPLPYKEVNISVKNKIRVVVIGSNYRSTELLLEIIEKSEKNRLDIEFHIIGSSKEWKEILSHFNNVILYKYIEEAEYFEVIRNSHIHLLPLEFATANNALLEAHALGVPSLVSNIEGVIDYSVSTTEYFNEADSAISVINKLCEMKDEEYKQIRDTTLTESKKFYWNNISVQIQDFYEELLKKRDENSKSQGVTL